MFLLFECLVKTKLVIIKLNVCQCKKKREREGKEKEGRFGKHHAPKAVYTAFIF